MSKRTERLSGELVLRYGCATLVTLVAAAGAQLVVRTDFVLAIIALCLVGAPISLFLRLHEMRVLGMKISRPLWNGFTSFAWFIAAAVWTISSLSDLVAIVMSGGASQGFWLRFGAGESLSLLMQVFLLFAAFRSFALISDKDATLATVPSFSVLLLLIPVHHGIEVVVYFLIWTLGATTLFALDHRSELARSVDGRVPASLPGQDVRLAARGLATVLAAAMVAAFALSYFLTSRNADDRSKTESAISNLAGRLVQFALQTSSESTGGGPERQIDFSSGPALPSRALLWQVTVVGLDDKPLRPQYFRLFSLSRYSGSTWTQSPSEQKRVNEEPLTRAQWPLPYARRNYELRQGGRDGNRPPLSRDSTLRSGFVIDKAWPEVNRVFGHPTRLVRIGVQSNVANLGFIPLLPGVRTVRLRDSNISEVRTRSDNAVELGFIGAGQNAGALASVPEVAEYGFPGGAAPTKIVAAQPDSPRLSSAQRAAFGQVPPVLSKRVREFARRALLGAKPQENNLGRAQRLALAIQRGATYTLRPPSPPTGAEATEFFLFEGNRRGYCTHFASALTVLCRSQGIPARVVSGFVANEYNPNGQALLRDANAHAWTEVWVEHWGWALVDATPAADRGDNAPNWLSLGGDWIMSVFGQAERWSRTRLWGLGFWLATLLVAVYAFRRRALLRAWWTRRTDSGEDLEWSRQEIIAAYERASLGLSRQFRPREASETPDEWLVAAIEFAAKSPTSLELPLRQLRELTGLYLRARYAPEPPAGSLVVVARELVACLKWKKAAS